MSDQLLFLVSILGSSLYFDVLDITPWEIDVWFFFVIWAIKLFLILSLMSDKLLFLISILGLSSLNFVVLDIFHLVFLNHACEFFHN